MTAVNPSDDDKILKLCHLTIENANLGVLWVDNSGKITNANKTAGAILQCEKHELIARNLSEINPEMDKYKWADLWTAIQGRSSLVRNTEYISRHQKSIPVEESLCLIEMGDVQYVSIYFHDITDRQLAEKALRESQLELEARLETLDTINKIINKLHRTLDLQSVVEASVDAMMDYIQSPSVVIFRLDKAAGQLVLLHAKGFGEDTMKIGGTLPVKESLTGQAVTQQDIAATYDIASDTRVYPIVQKELVREGLTCAISVPVVSQDGIIGAMNLICEDREPLSVYEKETLLSIGKAIGSALANAEQVKRIRDEIRERKRAEKQVQASRRKWRSLVENFHDIVFISDYEGRMLYANPPLEEQTGYESGQITGPLGQFPFMHTDDTRAMERFVSDFAAGDKSYSGILEHRVLDATGQVRWYSTAITKVEYEEKRALQFVSYDMTPRKQAELALQDALAKISVLKNRLQEENIYLQEEIKLEHNADEIIGDSSALKEVKEKMALVARTNATVLILGETGTGKELISRAIHESSLRRDHPMIKVNCSAIPRDLFESEFFGHVKGAFTGALKDRIGRFQLADHGTLFLDEIGEIPIELQGKLLRVLQEGQFERVGDDTTRQVDVRIISSTNRNLEEEVSRNTFRQDLYFRLSVFPVTVPPLRERLEDIPALARHFIKKISRRIGVPEVKLTDDHFRLLQSYSWPGNIRELENVIERALITSQSGRIDIILPDTPAHAPESASDEDIVTEVAGGRILTRDAIRKIEMQSVINALKKTNWKIYGEGGAAELLGIHASTLVSRMKAWGISKDPSTK